MELKEVVRRDGEIIMEEPPVEGSRSNGYVERAIQTVQDHIRTMKSASGRYDRRGRNAGSPGFAMACIALREPAQQIPTVEVMDLWHAGGSKRREKSSGKRNAMVAKRRPWHFHIKSIMSLNSY